jgi:hypothetical protein
MVLGELLVLGLLVFGLWQWWDQQTKLAHYQAANRAAAAFDWDTARLEYAAAPGFQDADQQAARAGRMIIERAEQYRMASAAAEHGDWMGVLDIVPGLRAIAPNYRDLAALTRAAEAQVPALALSGTVALRYSADPVGLYYHNGARWQWLPISDTFSRVRSVCPDGDLLFDAPVVPAPPDAGDTPEPPPRNPTLAGRRLQTATRAGAVARPLALDPAAYDAFTCTAAGVWAMRPGEQLPGGANDLLPPFNLDLALQARDAPAAVTPTLQGPAWAVLAAAPRAARLLLLDTTGVTPDAWRTRLYLADAGGRLERTLLVHPGLPWRAQISPDGHYMLALVRETAAASPDLTETLLLLDPVDGLLPRILITAHHARSASRYVDAVIGTFLAHGPRAGQVLLTWPDVGRQRLRLMDPAQPGRPLLDRTLSRLLPNLEVLADDPPDGGLLLGQLYVDPGTDSSSVVYLDGGGAVREFTVPLPAGAQLAGAWLRRDRLVYATRNAPGDSDAFLYTFASLPLHGDPVSPVVLFSGRRSTATGDPPDPWWIGPRFFVYRDEGGHVFALSYDGRLRVPLEPGLAGFFSADPAYRPPI